MKKNFYYFITLFLIILFFILGVYFSKDVYFILNKININIENFEKKDLDNFIKEITEEVLNPSPLIVKNPFIDINLTSDDVFIETNLQRSLNGNLQPLKRNKLLDEVALKKANDMFKNQYFDHNSPSGVTPAQLVKESGYEYIITGENLILGNFASEKDLVVAWMNSQGHRENILNNRYTEIGIALVRGVYKNQKTWIGVQEFGLGLSACNQPDILLKKEIDLYKNKIDNLSLQIDQKKEEINNSITNYKEYNLLIQGYNDLVKQYDNLAELTKSLIVKYNSQVGAFNKCVAGE